MSRRKFLVRVLLLIFLSGNMVNALNYLASNEDSITRILGYDVYKIEGSGNYTIYYPLPNGSIKVLKRGKAGGIFPVFVKVPREEWVGKLSTSGEALYAPPTPLILYITPDGKLGVKSITASRIRLENEEDLNLKDLNLKGSYQAQSSCPNGWIDFGGRYCLSPNWDFHFESNAKTKTFDEWITITGLKIENNVAEEVYFAWDLSLSSSTYSYWTIGIDVGPFTVLSVSKGHKFEGQALYISYQSKGPLVVDSDTWERYLSIRVEYIIVHSKVPAYDKLAREYVWIEIAQTYPVKIHSTGEYTIRESSTRGIYFTESNGNNPPRITTTPNIWSLPKEAEWKRTWISNTGDWEDAIYIKQSQSYSFSSTSSLSIPIGYAGGRYLSSISPTLGRLASALSLTFGFYKYMNVASYAKYSVDIKPRRDCYAMYSILNVKVGESGPKVEVPLVFGVITDGKTPTPPCNPETNLCITTTNKIKET
ncbi:hypothetical protein PFDSM3638_02695 [Pyrococcus furiosus DSM 3638]|uniref:Uncharacterized protein n=3 Tax=Pyrococcus furiosus TaxID=2261 RepID=Q8U3D1_PYRFU|nr:hypothetical protein [Pyrococcus furiosus]AAL80662.1 hypothetical protein PF0538 [Pyrococcus furiosus DSM 3638]AFN03333.1 hypothetical protein PFC_01810 [Pyrococcus furiosus COM1]QEK78249.1 hypothetical protein PFDSM3638_02695 [Pyrococcus furiosus DSM 3638]